MNFKIKNQQQTVVDIVEFISDYIVKYPKHKIVVGTDSQFVCGKVNYVTAIVLISGERNGARVLINKTVETNDAKRKISVFERLSKEGDISLNVAKYLADKGIYIDGIELDCQKLKKTKSTAIYLEKAGWFESEGFKVYAKPDILSSTVAADRFTR